ncbi:MAG: serine hydrolase, partial [Allosphingosinicella sp.]
MSIAGRWISGRWIFCLLACLWTTTAAAAEPSPAFSARAKELVLVMKGETAPERFFSPSFLTEVPAERVRAIAAQLKASYGPVGEKIRIEPAGPAGVMIFISYERAIVRFQMAVDPEPPHLVEGLRVVGVESTADDVPSLLGEIAGLPGEVSLAAARLEDAGPASFLARK